MTKKLLYGAFAGFFAVLAACSTDFDITAPWKQIPIVYGVLSPKDTAHYVRVEKAFLDDSRSALELAQFPDSLYFDPSKIAVYLERADNNQRAELTRVDGNLEGYVRESGPFATQPNWLYKLPNTALGGIQEGKTYRIIVQQANDGAEIARSETTIPASFTFRKPFPQSTPPRISFFPSLNTEIEWLGDINAQYYDITLYIPYRELDANDVLIKQDTLVWVVGRNVERTQLQQSGGYIGEIKVAGVSFYKFLAQQLDPANGRRRTLLPIDIRVDGGGRELKAYYDAIAANSGLTGAEYIPAFTNIEGGYGLFTSKNTSIFKSVFFTELTLDSLNIHPDTQPLGFDN